MKDDGSPLGGPGKVVESDEAFIGGSAKKRLSGKTAPMKKVVALVERDGRARSFHVANLHHEQYSRGTGNEHRSPLHANDRRCPLLLGYRPRVREATDHASREQRV